MKRTLPWLISAVLLVAFCASFAELQRMRKRFGEVTRPVLYHRHADVRETVIAQQLARVEAPIVVLGDSLIEATMFPSAICGHAVINAGIGGAKLSDFGRTGFRFLYGSRPALIVIALGVNDALSQSQTFERDLIQVLGQLRQLSPNVIAFGIADAETGLLVDNSSELNGAIANQNDVYAKIMGGAFSPAPLLGSAHTLDGIHLAPNAYRRWAGALFASIEAAVLPPAPCQ